MANCSYSLTQNRCSAPYPPSPDETDQHAVVTLTMPCAPVTLLGITCDTGIEPVNAAPRVTQGVLQTQPNLAQLAGVCSPLFLSDYRLHRLLDQLSLPVQLLNARVEIAIFLR